MKSCLRPRLSRLCLPSSWRGAAQSARPAPAQSSKRKKLALDAKRVLCVASCKGGVGKSSVSLNLACALANRGERVGVLDMDVFGPSLPALLPRLLDETPRADADGNILPFVWGHAILPEPLQVMSYGYLKPGEFAAIRGPIVAGLSKALLTTVAWQNLDTLIIDMPPGTGDIHLSTAQELTVDAAIMVTTPEKLALVDVEKGIRMFDKVGIPTVALVENMAYFDCGNCATRHHIFGEGGGRRMAEQFGINTFFQLPIDPQVNSSKREGLPPLLASKRLDDSPIGMVSVVNELAQSMERELDSIAASRSERPRAEAVEGGAKVSISRGGEAPLVLEARELRLACKCANCVDEWTGKMILRPEKVSPTVQATSVEPAGRYAFRVQWTDLHRPGGNHGSIYSFASVLETFSESAKQD